MKYPYLALLLSGGLLCGQEAPAAPVSVVSAAEETAAKSRIEESTAALRNLHKVLSGLKNDEDVKVALPAIEKAIADYDAAMNALPKAWTPQEADLVDWRRAHRALRDLCTLDEFVVLVWANDALMYYLLLSSENLPCYLHEDTAEYMMMSVSMPGDETDPDMVPHCDKVRNAAADRHAAYMSEHADSYSGGNGADAASAIVLKPLVAAGNDENQNGTEELEQKLIAEYMHAVYPQFNAGYSFVRASPDGSFYIIMTQYPGVYENAQGQLKLISFYVYFCTKLPDKRE